MNKVCTSCKKEKPFGDFNKEKLGKHGLASKCKNCIYELAIIRRKEKHIKNNTLSPSDRLLQKIGTAYITNEGYKIEILECFSYTNCTIRFENGLVLTKMHFGSIKKGQVKNPYHPNNYGVGYLGIGKYKPVIDKKCTPSFKKWCNIIERGYSSLLKEKQPTYKNCTVDEHWHNFQVFAEWFEDNYKPYMDGWVLDKDILVKRNKIYSPETCSFVPAEINGLFVKNNTNRGSCVIGVSEHKNKYKAYVNTNSTKIRYLGTFDTELEAFQAYKIAKEGWIKEVADKWKDLISDHVYQAMYNYKVELTD